MKICFVVLVFAGLVSLCAGSATVMPYFGLERTGEDIEADLKELKEHTSQMRVVSPECFNLGPNGTIIHANLTNIIPTLHALDVPTILPMISTFHDTPPHRRTTDIDDVRALFANPDGFIKQAIEYASSMGFVGYAFDLEPQTGATVEDGKNYPGFLTKFCDEAHKHGLQVQINCATWSDLFDYSAIAKTSIDYVIDMNTYAGDNETFKRYLEKAVAAVGSSKLVSGLITTNPNTKKPFSVDDMKFRFDLLKQHNVKKIAIWEMPVPQDWWRLIDDFLLS